MTIEELILKWEQKKVTAKHKRYSRLKRGQCIEAKNYDCMARVISAMLRDLKNI